MASLASSSARSTTRSISIWTSPTAPKAWHMPPACSRIASRVAGLRRRSPASRRSSTTRRGCWPISRGRARHGFGAKLCIHPRQVAPIHAALAPSAQAIDWARRVLAAEAASPGAAQLDGRMIDRPVVLQAQRTLQRAGS